MSTKMIPFVVAFAMFMEAVDSTILNTAIPVMSESLQVNPIDLKIALISYLLSLAIFIPISGWLADKYGIKKVFIYGLSIFTFSSFFCGLAQNLPELVIARIVQGMGGSVMLPIGRLIIVRSFQKHEILSKMNMVIMVGAIGLMIGPTLGGFITHYLNWRWIFYVNIPFGLINIAFATLFLPTIVPKAVHKLDRVGFILFGFGLAGLTFGVSALSESTINVTFCFIIIAIAILLLILYFAHSRSRAHPILNTQVFKFRTFRVSVWGNLISRMSFGGIPFLTPILLQMGLGYTPEKAGLLLAPIALGVIVAKPLSFIFLHRIGYKKFLIVNTMLMSIMVGLFALIDQQTSNYFILLFTFVFGFLSAQQYTGMNSIAYSEINNELYSSATSILSTLQQLSQSFGVAIAALLIQYFSPALKNTMSISIHALHYTYIAMGILTFLSVIIFLNLRSSDGKELLYV